ncbi:hypothetical protein [Cerasicoccus frondis]|uniref:hypothetical protein n=1 Tax=Cerasicoccus frondis TaxID=490090 RepID=UPI00285255B6|nr:hypothetical protein [Cerasicoccus frondis]
MATAVLAFYTSLILPHLAQAQREVPVKFKVFLWPSYPTEGGDTRIIEKVDDDGNPYSSVEHVAPRIKYSPTGDEVVEEIQAAQNRMSPIYEYRGVGPIQFFRSDSGGRKTIGSVNLPEGLTDVILVFFPPAKNGFAKIFPVNAGSSNLKSGEARIYNLCSNSVACLFNDQKMLLESGASNAAKLGPSNETSVLVRLGSQIDDERWKERFARKLPVNPNESLIVFIYNKDGNPRKFRLLTINNQESDFSEGNSET